MLNRWILVPVDRASLGVRERGFEIVRVADQLFDLDAPRRCRVINNRTLKAGPHKYVMVRIPESLLRRCG